MKRMFLGLLMLLPLVGAQAAPLAVGDTLQPFTITDQHGTERGRVVEIIANPASDLLELESGALVPVRFVTSVDPGARVVVDVPDGLFDLG